MYCFSVPPKPQKKRQGFIIVNSCDVYTSSRFFGLADVGSIVKKILIIYRSGERTTVEYDETKVDLFDVVGYSVVQKIDFCSTKQTGLSLFIKTDEVAHMEVLK